MLLRISKNALNVKSLDDGAPTGTVQHQLDLLVMLYVVLLRTVMHCA